MDQPNFHEPSSSDDEVLLKPVFVPKNARKTIQNNLLVTESHNSAEESERKADSRHLVAEAVKQQANLEASKQQSVLDVDDTDGVNEVEEIQAWKLRELNRLKRDLLLKQQQEREFSEMEAIRNMPEDEKAEYHRKHIENQTKEKESKSKYQFLQKYYHKGAFFMDTNEEIYQRDYNQPGESDRHDKLSLPSAMQVRDYGKSSRSKWTHLSAEDTTSFEYGWSLDTEVTAKAKNQLAGVNINTNVSNNKKRKL